MGKGYLFISNGTKPTETQRNARQYIIGTFELAPIESAKALHYDIYIGASRNNPESVVCEDDDAIMFYDQHTYRSIFAVRDNFIAYKNLCHFLEAHPEIEVIHCNTPIGGFMGRLCGHKYRVKKIIYAAHGFHFFKGAHLFNNTFLKCIEKILAHWTDVIITMNEEDYVAAKKMRLRGNGRVYKIPGVGVYTDKYVNKKVDREAVRKKLNISEHSFLGICMGDIVPRKNYETAIKAIALTNNPNIHYIICGKGKQEDELKELSKKLGVAEQVHFLGFRQDIIDLSLASDFFLFASSQEGLPRSTMEAMCAGLPCVVSSIRGNVDLIENEIGGYLIEPRDSEGFANAIIKLEKDRMHAKTMGEHNVNVIKNFDISIVKSKMLDIYKAELL